MAIAFDYSAHLIHLTRPQDTLSCQELIDAIRAEEATATGIRYEPIATAILRFYVGERGHGQPLATFADRDDHGQFPAAELHGRVIVGVFVERLADALKGPL